METKDLVGLLGLLGFGALVMISPVLAGEVAGIAIIGYIAYEKIWKPRQASDPLEPQDKGGE